MTMFFKVAVYLIFGTDGVLPVLKPEIPFKSYNLYPAELYIIKIYNLNWKAIGKLSRLALSRMYIQCTIYQIKLSDLFCK